MRLARYLRSLRTTTTTTAATLALFGWSAGCGSVHNGSGFQSKTGHGGNGGDDGGVNGGGGPLGGGGSGGIGSLGDGGGSAPGGCVGLQCQVHTCSGGGSTTISGKVFDPAGKEPLYDIVVYIPNAPLDPLTQGAGCYSCDQLYSGQPITTTLTDPAGHFTLTNAPDGSNIPIVVQIGKWRMQFTIPHVGLCTDNLQPDGMLHLPKNHMQGDIPNIAISTGRADSLECLFIRMGIDPGEYSGDPNGQGRIHIFQGGDDGTASNTNPPAPASSASLWDSKADLMRYDLVLLSCEGAETSKMNQQAMVDYTSAGGRVFASHFHYSWFNSGPFAAHNLATWTTGADPIIAGDGGLLGSLNSSILGVIDTTLANGQPFPKGQAMQQWLGNVGALTNGELMIYQPKHNADVSMANAASQQWIHADTSSDNGEAATQYFSFDTPVGVDPSMQCGRVVYSDLHVGGDPATMDYGGGIGGGGVTPSGCGQTPLSAQEKALEFMLYDLSSCLTPVTVPPQPPSPTPK